MNISIIRNPEEIKAKRYLESLGYSNINYEPLGNNSPPDFEIDNNIAVEVRRLNQYIFYEENKDEEKESKPEPIEKATNTLSKSFEKIIKEFNSLKPEKSFWISFHFKRPIDLKKNIIRKLRLKLKAFNKEEVDFPYVIRIMDNLNITIRERSELSRQKFWIASESDHDIGGWSFQVVENYINSINYCIKDKENKIMNCSDKYGTWWLILVDTIRCGAHPSHDEINDIRAKANRSKIFNRIIIISYEDGKKILEY